VLAFYFPDMIHLVLLKWNKSIYNSHKFMYCIHSLLIVPFSHAVAQMLKNNVPSKHLRAIYCVTFLFIRFRCGRKKEARWLETGLCSSCEPPG